jgi:hypothetical protein
MDLVNNFEARLQLKKIKNQRLVFVDFGEGEIVYKHCGAFVANKNNSYPTVSNYDFPETNKLNSELQRIINTPLIITDEEKILQAYNYLIENGQTKIGKNDIARKAFGYSKSNGRVGPIITATLQNMPFFQ